MFTKKRWLISLIFLIVLAGVYLYPTPAKPFDELYANVDAETVHSLVEFRQAHPVRTLEVRGVEWTYLSLGRGS